MSAVAEVRSLFRAFLREGRRFPNYNIREYIQRRAREGFHDAAQISDGNTIQSLLKTGRDELEVVKRQSVVYNLYGRKFKNVLELDMDLKRGTQAAGGKA